MNSYRNGSGRGGGSGREIIKRLDGFSFRNAPGRPPPLREVFSRGTTSEGGAMSEGGETKTRKQEGIAPASLAAPNGSGNKSTEEGAKPPSAAPKPSGSDGGLLYYKQEVGLSGWSQHVDDISGRTYWFSLHAGVDLGRARGSHSRSSCRRTWR